MTTDIGQYMYHTKDASFCTKLEDYGQWVKYIHFVPLYFTGAVIIPSAVFGIIVGGVLMKRLKLPMPGIAKFMLAMYTLPIIAIIILFFLGCTSVDLAGINAGYTEK